MKKVYDDLIIINLYYGLINNAGCAMIQIKTITKDQEVLL